ncbi:MAG: hypothetical protein GF355_16390 [Candidatus Eisenbacteria bacterium]|nr:hypothetical protein [Candidatus Eisenbacteria bacterium]
MSAFPPQLAALDERLARRRGMILIMILAAALFLGWISRFIQDDAFISFVYARELVQGNGLTWFGVTVEGYTNFLWVVWIAAGMAAGIEPVFWSQLSGLAAFLLAVYAAWRLARRVSDSDAVALFCALAFITNRSAAAYATGGLETMLQTALLTLALWLVYELWLAREARRVREWLLGAVALLAILTRMDSGLVLAVIGVAALAVLARRRAGPAHYARLAVPPLAGVAAWFIWKAAAYGSLLPNSYHAKVDFSMEIAGHGLVYLWRFLHWYALWPLFLAAAAGYLLRGAPRAARLLPPVAILVLWGAYVVYVGGDFMEFRFLVPVTPVLMLVLGVMILHALGGRAARLPAAGLALALLILAGASLRHALTFTSMTDDLRLDSIPVLATFYGRYPEENWDRLGRPLGEQLNGTGAVLASSAVGAIPYYSDLKTIDMWGLNDPHIPEIGSTADPEQLRPGHVRYAPLSYLRSRGVNLVIDHPTTIPRGGLDNEQVRGYALRWFRRIVASPWSSGESPGSEVTLVAMPINEAESLLMWYLIPSPDIQAVMSRNDWETLSLRLD